MRYYIYNCTYENPLQSVMELTCKPHFRLEKARPLHKSCSFCMWRMARDNYERAGDLLVNDNFVNDCVYSILLVRNN